VLPEENRALCSIEGLPHLRPSVALLRQYVDLLVLDLFEVDQLRRSAGHGTAVDAPQVYAVLETALAANLTHHHPHVLAAIDTQRLICRDQVHFLSKKITSSNGSEPALPGANHLLRPVMQAERGVIKFIGGQYCGLSGGVQTLGGLEPRLSVLLIPYSSTGQSSL
jgi:hypothetical protein